MGRGVVVVPRSLVAPPSPPHKGAGGGPRPALSSIALVIAAALLLSSTASAQESKYPNLRGQWERSGPVAWDTKKPPGRGQQAPLNAEYQTRYDASLAEEAKSGGQTYNPQVRCVPPGMPRAMIGYEPIEILVTPDITYMRLHFMGEFRRIYTDGRDWPAHLAPTYIGTSIGHWIDTAGSGRYDTLEVETRGFKGPRLIENTGIPLHLDNQTIIKERIHLDATDANLLHDDVTLIDDAFTRPWTVTRDFRRRPQAVWIEYLCSENNNLVIIGGESYFVREDGYLMPMGKGQRPPDLRNFAQPGTTGRE
ncbi:MAG TPA: hypothetical protein VKW08_14590 [Xanthobacteraceae bacterium]|nr:hypothetical protein [Xanthobacteraceae bacterium]